MTIKKHRPIARSAYPVVFTIARFFAFAPVLLVLLSRWIHQDG